MTGAFEIRTAIAAIPRQDGGCTVVVQSYLQAGNVSHLIGNRVRLEHEEPPPTAPIADWSWRLATQPQPEY